MILATKSIRMMNFITKVRIWGSHLTIGKAREVSGSEARGRFQSS